MDWDGFPGWLFKRDFVVSPVSIHFPYSKVSRNRKTTKSLEKSHYKITESEIVSRDFVASPASRHFPHSKVSRNRKKSLEKVIIFKGFCCFSCFLTFFICFQSLSVFKGFCCFQTLLGKVGRLESWNSCTITPSRAPQARGVCNCIQATIPYRPARD